MKEFKISKRVSLSVNEDNENPEFVPKSFKFEDNRNLLEQIAIAINKKLPALLMGETGSGKCLGKGTPVLMYNGSIKRVEDIKVGELLMGDNSTPRKVLSLARGREMMYKVIPVKGDSYIVNESHILSLKMTKHGKGKPGYSSTYPSGSIVDISVNDYLKKTKRWKHLAKGYRNGVSFSKKNLLIEPYFLGTWLGDGTSSNVSVTTKDKEIVDYLNSYAKRLGLKCVKENTTDKTKCPKYSITKGYHGNSITGFSLQGNLRKLGVLKNKHIPSEYLVNSRKNRLQLLAGLIDTDGYTSSNGYYFGNINERLIDSVVYLARSLGFAAYKKSYIARIKSINYEVQAFKVSISGDCSVIPVKIRRKKVSVRRQKKDVLVTGIKVEKLKIDNYYGFEIDGNKRFLLGDFTVTHNTSLVRYLAQQTNNCFRRVNHNGGTTVDDIVGKILINKEGTYWVNGVLVEALKKGYWYLADELNAASAEINFVYHSLLDDDGFIVLSENNGEIVRPHPNFRFFAAMNPSADYSGTKELNKALLSRFIVFKTDFPSPETEKKVLVDRTSIKSEIANKMIKFAAEIRASHGKGKLNFVLSTRDLLMWATMFQVYKKYIVSSEMSVLNKVDEDDFESVKDLIALHFKSLDTPVKKKSAKQNEQEEDLIKDVLKKK